MKTQFTKGEWIATDQADGWGSTKKDIILSDEKNGKGKRKAVASALGLCDGVNNRELEKEQEANAKLIAAAPDLFIRLCATNEVLRYLIDEGILNEKDEEMLKRNITAIKKATS